MKKIDIKNIVLSILIVVVFTYIMGTEKEILIVRGISYLAIFVPFFIGSLMLTLYIPEALGEKKVVCRNSMFMYVSLIEIYIAMVIFICKEYIFYCSPSSKICWIIVMIVLLIAFDAFLLTLRNTITIFGTEGVIHRSNFGKVYLCTYDEIKTCDTRYNEVKFYIGNRRVMLNIMSTNYRAAVVFMHKYDGRGRYTARYMW